MTGDMEQTRHWKSDSWLEDGETLERRDYTGAFGELDVIDYLVSIDEIERRSGLDFLRELPDDSEPRVEVREDRV